MAQCRDGVRSFLDGRNTMAKKAFELSAIAKVPELQSKW